MNTALGYSGNDKVKVLYSAPDENDNIDQQVNILDEELARYPDVIAISSVDASACSVQFDLAIENGIPIVAFDSGNSYQNIQSTCKTNNIEAATTGTKNFCEKIGDSGEILLLVHDTVSDTAKEREAGIKNELAALVLEYQKLLKYGLLYSTAGIPVIQDVLKGSLISFLTMIVLVIVMTFLIWKNRNIMGQNTFLLMKEEMEKQKYEEIRASIEQNKELVHDTKNHYLVISE